MEMYADAESRGGVLEPEGIVGIKYKRDRQLQTMERLDAMYGDLKRRATDKSLSPEQRQELKVKIEAREELLLPVYAQISLQFADLHDRAGRMEAKGTIRSALQWKEARRFFYWRVRRRLNEETVLRKLTSASSANTSSSTASTASTSSSSSSSSSTSLSPNTTNGAPTGGARERHLSTLKAWSSLTDAQWEKDDRAVAAWYEDTRKDIQAKIDALRTQAVAADVAALLRSNKDGGLKGVKQVLAMLPVEEREGVLGFLRG
jgi:acetyl-CoA carboxylase/biotin carboxylase 1